MTRLSAGIGALVIFGAVQTYAGPKDPPPSSELLLNANNANADFAAVGQLKTDVTCTGSLIDPAGLGGPDSKAWLLTAGHCISLEPYGVIRNQPSTAQVQFNYFTDTKDRRVTVKARTTGWATMKGVDLALVELSATLGELAAQGIRPLRLGLTEPPPGRAVFWTGIPLNPIPAEMQYIRVGRCTLGSKVQLIEGPWIWNADLSNDCPDLFGGASGSPLFDALSGAVIGVIGTGTLLNFDAGPDFDCQVNHPCEVYPKGPTMQRDTSYVSPIEGLARCFDQANLLDVTRTGCPLDPGVQLSVQSGPSEVQPQTGGKLATWGAALSGSLTYYSYKRFRAGGDACNSFVGYSPPVAVASAPVIADPIGRDEGYYFLCVIAGNTATFDSTWQQPAFATMRFKRLDSQPPLVLVDYQLDTLIEGYQLTLLGGGPGLGITLKKKGPLGSTDCADPQGYRGSISIPDVVKTTDLPYRICVRISDKAGNLGDPAVFDFGPATLFPNAVRNAASNERGAVAPASAVRLDGFALTNITQTSPVPVATLGGVRTQLVDRAGRSLPVLLTSAGPLSLEGVMPAGALPGPAMVIVQPPQGPTISQKIMVRRTAPGFYSGMGTGVSAGFAFSARGAVYPLVTCPRGQACTATALPLSTTPGGLDFVLYGTGFRAGLVRLRVGTYTVYGFVRQRTGSAGVDEVFFHLPQDFPLRLFQAVVGSGANVSWVYLQ